MLGHRGLPTLRRDFLFFRGVMVVPGMAFLMYAGSNAVGEISP
jgi:hypothetical protein